MKAKLKETEDYNGKRIWIVSWFKKSQDFYKKSQAIRFKAVLDERYDNSKHRRIDK